MFGTEFLWETLINLIRTFLFNYTKAARYARYALKVRDMLLLLFPVEMYPTGSVGDAVLDSIGAENVTAVPVEAVRKAAKEYKFNLPFVKGK